MRVLLEMLGMLLLEMLALEALLEMMMREMMLLEMMLEVLPMLLWEEAELETLELLEMLVTRVVRILLLYVARLGQHVASSGSGGGWSFCNSGTRELSIREN